MRAEDADLIALLNSDREVMRYLTGRPLTIEESRAEVAASLGNRWLLFTLDDGGFVGWVGADPAETQNQYDIGWRLVRSAWGHGLASEAARALVDELFDHGADRVTATTMAVNARSRGVMERIGLEQFRTFHLDIEDPLPGTEHGEVEYHLARRAWDRSRSAESPSSIGPMSAGAPEESA
jgi:RimJ/RimL family protein N-acetyltransferase